MEVVVTTASFESSGFDATVGRTFLFQEVERHMSQDHKVLLTVILAHVTGIFLKRDVEDRVSDQFQPESRLRTASPKARASSGKLMRE